MIYNNNWQRTGEKSWMFSDAFGCEIVLQFRYDFLFFETICAQGSYVFYMSYSSSTLCLYKCVQAAFTVKM